MFRWYLLAIVPGILWGVSGAFCQYLFQVKQVSPEWLVTNRLLISGIILLAIAGAAKKDIWTVWKHRKDALQLLIFGIAGMAAVQYTYFAAIHASNAATATVLQYVGPGMICVYLIIRNRKAPTLKELLALSMALIGTFLLVTHGNAGSLSISNLAVFWGLTSALALAFYSLQPLQLLKKWSSVVIIGWAMLIGGTAFCFVQNPFQSTNVQWDLSSLAMVAFIILLGSLFSFYAYLISVQYIGAAKASLLACVEPLAATFFAVTWLNVPFGVYDWMGTVLILAMVLVLTVKNNKEAFSG
ncbi:MAG: EamA family transporter [Chitinophagaceae bacterium]|nr:EamA family transporter [Chitinophagaceae bacterium]MCW5927084.1 EamA family transporter [Chitinophagaceae bacterium]